MRMEAGKGIRGVAKAAFQKKVHDLVVMGEKEKIRTLVVTEETPGQVKARIDKKKDTHYQARELVNGVHLDIILAKAVELRYEIRKAYGPNGKVNRVYLAKPQQA